MLVSSYLANSDSRRLILAVGEWDTNSAVWLGRVVGEFLGVVVMTFES